MSLPYRWRSLGAGWPALFGLLLLAAGCGGGGSPIPVSTGGSSSAPTGTAIHGRVVDSITQAPIQSAAVAVAGRSTRTGKDGTFALSVPAGAISVQITAANYNPVTISTMAAANELNEVGDIPLSSSSTGPPSPPL